MLGKSFDPDAELSVHRHWRPHWSQAGTIVFITFRTHDSIPREVVNRWDREKREWLHARGHVDTLDIAPTIARLSDRERAEFQKRFDRARETCLDTCHGRCLLRRLELAQIVSDTLLHFDGQRYRMGDFVVMPNHVHLLTAIPTADAMKKQCRSWLHYLAAEINKAIGQKGRFWHQEPFDHLVRSEEQYEYLRSYIADSPLKAKLRKGEYIYRRLAD